MALKEAIPRLQRELEIARLGESARIAEAIQVNRVVGVLGEGEVGKTETVGQAIGPSTPELAVIRLDLDGAAGNEHLAFRLAKQIAAAYLGASQFSTLKVGALVPASIEAGRLELAELIGLDGVDEALRDWPSGTYPLERSLAGLEGLARRREVILWIDHLEAPALTPRHPLDLDRFLWAIRELAQRVPSLKVVLSGRGAAEGRVLGPEAAFHQQGRWLTLDNPPPDTWQKMAGDLRLPGPAATELARLTGGHPATMLLALLRLAEGREEGPHEVLRDLAGRHAGLTARAIQHAHSLHRLGGQAMVQVANGLGPYAMTQRGASPAQEIRKVLGRLQLAGLLRRDERWSVVNPLVAIGLRGEVPLLSAPDWELEPEPEGDAD